MLATEKIPGFIRTPLFSGVFLFLGELRFRYSSME